MFSPQNEPFTCTNYNAATEKHGPKYVKVGDLKVEMNLSNTVLDEFGPDFRTFLYSKENERPVKRDSEKPTQKDLLPNDGMTELRHADLSPLELNSEWTGYKVTIKTELGKKAPLEFEDCVLSAFKFNALKGGTVKLTFNVRVKPTPEQSGALHYIVREPCRISLTPPAAGPLQADIEGSEKKAAGDTLDQQNAKTGDKPKGRKRAA